MRRRVIEWPIRLLVVGSLLLPGCLVNQKPACLNRGPGIPRPNAAVSSSTIRFPGELGPVGGPRPPGMSNREPKPGGRWSSGPLMGHATPFLLVAVLAERGPGTSPSRCFPRWFPTDRGPGLDPRLLTG
ncbi:MAG: hypothetical protein Ct9H300mP1_31970 [Planctomycetaceae bacterium]|nr:MAG: hypothetical protein Ct9H300mP1_31970 [Planctomycetaceae bacterium]